MSEKIKFVFLLAVSILLIACEPHGVFYHEERVYVPRSRVYVAERRVYAPEKRVYLHHREPKTINEQTTIQANLQQQNNQQNVVIHNYGSPQTAYQNETSPSRNQEYTRQSLSREEIYISTPKSAKSGGSEGSPASSMGGSGIAAPSEAQHSGALDQTPPRLEGKSLRSMSYNLGN